MEIRSALLGSLTLAAIPAWLYFVLYNWLWLGLVTSTSIGWAVGYGILFLIFLFAITPYLILIVGGIGIALLFAD